MKAFARRTDVISTIFNPRRLGNGPGPHFTVDCARLVTVVSHFITEGCRDDGDLLDIRRLYVIPNSKISIAAVRGNSVDDRVCARVKRAFGDIDDFNFKGGLKTMGDALSRGMVRVTTQGRICSGLDNRLHFLGRSRG